MIKKKNKKYNNNILFLILLKNNKSYERNVKNSKLRACMDFEESKLDDIICHGFIL